jgi:ATP-binding cassette subfamily F protein uup
VAEAEEVLDQARAALLDPAIASDAAQLQAAVERNTVAEQAVDALYSRWSELEAKLR